MARRGISVNIVQAGPVDTQMVPASPEILKAMVSCLAIQRVSDPPDTAAVITSLASPAASYVTGAVIDSNGGYTPDRSAVVSIIGDTGLRAVEADRYIATLAPTWMSMVATGVQIG